MKMYSMVVRLTCCAEQEGVYGGLRDCPLQKHWEVCGRQRPESRCGK